MLRRLAFAVAVCSVSCAASAAEMKGMSVEEIVGVSKARALDFRLSQEMGVTRQEPLLRGMIVHQALAPNAVVGFGLSNLYSKRSRSSDQRGAQRPYRGRKPAVTFILNF